MKKLFCDVFLVCIFMTGCGCSMNTESTTTETEVIETTEETTYETVEKETLETYTLKSGEVIEVEDSQGRGNVITMDNVDKQKQIEKENKELTPFTAENSAEWKFSSTTSPSSNAYVKNRESNSNPIFFDVILSSTSEKLYTSSILNVGEKDSNIAFSKKLDKGTYQGEILYHILNKSHDRELRSYSMGISIVVR